MSQTPSGWQYFTLEELTCRCGCGRMEMDREFMRKLVALRRAFGVPLPLASAYRCPEHNARVSSTGPDGPHTTGRAVDPRVSGETAYRLVELALARGFTGIGIHQRGPMSSRFIHLDDLGAPHPRPRIWSY